MGSGLVSQIYSRYGYGNKQQQKQQPNLNESYNMYKYGNTATGSPQYNQYNQSYQPPPIQALTQEQKDRNASIIGVPASTNYGRVRDMPIGGNPYNTQPLNQQTTPASQSTINPYNTPSTTNIPADTTSKNEYAWNYMQNMPTALTPEQLELWKNQQAEQLTGQYEGARQRLGEQLGQGMGGGGAEAALAGQLEMSKLANMNKTMSNIELQNAQSNIANQMQKGGMLGGLAQGLGNLGLGYGQLGENARQYDVGTDTGMYKWGHEFDWEKYKDEQSRDEYMRQLMTMLQQLGIPTSGYGY